MKIKSKEINEIIIYESTENQIQVEVDFDGETVWLSQKKLSQLFKQTKQNISLHINNCFREGELDANSVVKESLTTASDGKKYKTKYYNLDVIISVGYRVKSKQGTQFRIWANRVLKAYLVKGYAINEKRLAQKEQEVKTLKDGIQILARSIGGAIEEKSSDNELLAFFAMGLSLLDDYDHEQLDKKGVTNRAANYPSLEDYQNIINEMLSEFDSDVFGKEKDKSFQSSVAQIEKGFGEKDFYPTLEEKAAMLLYLIVKNHSFVDGNKRIAAGCFLKFLAHNNMLFSNKKALISNDTLASLTLFIASSKAEEMETLKRLVISVLNRNK